MRQDHNKGFTLVELLVGIAIIALLAGITLAGVNGAREVSEKTKCTANLRQIGMATLMFCNENNGQFPMTTHDTTRNQETGAHDQSWVYTLAPYVEDVDDIRISPSDPQAEDRLAQGASSYLMNDYVSVVLKDFNFLTNSYVVQEDQTNILKLQNPTKTVIVFTCADTHPVSIDREHTHAREWTSFTVASREIQPDRYSDGANYLYADGHVGYIKANELEANFANGINIAEPPQS